MRMDVYVSEKTFGKIVDDTLLTVFESGDTAITSIGGITVICKKSKRNSPRKIFDGRPFQHYGYSAISTNEPSLGNAERFEEIMENLQELSPIQLMKIEAKAGKLREEAKRGGE